MKFPSRQPAVEGLPGVTGTVRLDRRTASLVRRLRAGDVAVVDHLDLDRATAEALVDCGVVAVVNASSLHLRPLPEPRSRAARPLRRGDGRRRRARTCSPSSATAARCGCTTGAVHRRRHHRGHRSRARRRGDRHADGGRPQRALHPAAELHPQHHRVPAPRAGAAAARPGRPEDPHGASSGRPVVVVVRGYDYREDLRGLKRFIREQRPVLVGVDAGADALIAAGHRPDIVVVGEDGLAQGSTAGERGSTVSDKALRDVAGGRAARRPLRSGDRRRPARPARRAAPDPVGVRHQRGRRPAARRRARRQPDHRGRHPRDPRRVPGPAAGRARQHLPDPAAGRPEAGRRQGRARSCTPAGSGSGTCCSCSSPASSRSAWRSPPRPVGDDWWSSIGGALSDVLDWIQGLFT